jgi:hypothetical protein
MPRQEYVERRKQRAFDYLEQGDLRNAVASFVRSMNARPDCRLQHHLATLGIVANGERCARLEDADRRGQVMVEAIS